MIIKNLKKILVSKTLLCFLLLSNISHANILYSQNDSSNIEIAIKAAENNDWPKAELYAKKVKDPLVLNSILWFKFLSGAPDFKFDEVINFYENIKLWPNSNKFRNRIEDLACYSKNEELVFAWYSKFAPKTSSGNLAFLNKLANKNNNEVLLKKMVRKTWENHNFSPAQEKTFLDKYKHLLTQENYIKKVDNLLWQKNIGKAVKYLDKLPKKDQLITKARIGLISENKDVEVLVKQVPKQYRNNLGLLYDRLIWHEKRENFSRIIHLSANIPNNPPYSNKWWEFKNRQVRNLLEKKYYKTAYNLISSHKNKSNSEFINAEWLAGWIALRFMHAPKLARKHFMNMDKLVTRPISASRAKYWLARTFEAEGNKKEANKWFEKASEYFTTYYGQLALAKLNKKINFPAEHNIKITDNDRKNFYNNKYAKLAYIFSYLKDRNIAHQFAIAAFYDAKTKGEILLLTQLGNKINKPNLTVLVAKYADYKKIPLYSFSYPKLTIAANKIGKGLIHSLIRQESMFDPKAISPAGALGLMQIMPNTAKMLAKSIKSRYNSEQLINDKHYNMKLGIHFLDNLFKTYKGSYILTIAAYNAGQHNVKKWIDRFGDPTKKTNIEEIIDWVELITFYETRNYVQRVLETKQIYDFILDKKKNSFIPTIINDLRKLNA